MATSNNSLALVSIPSYKDSHKEFSMQMNEEVKTTLTREAQSNPVFAAVAKVLSKRERNRHNLTTRGLYYKLRKEGFSFQEKELIPVFELLSRLGLAETHTDLKGRVDSIRKFKVPIQAIGAAVTGTGMPTRVRVAKIEAAPVKKAETMLEKMVAAPTTVTVHFNKKPIRITIPAEITKEELLTILSRFL